MGFAYEALGELDTCDAHLNEALRLLGRRQPASKVGWVVCFVREAGWQLLHGLLGRWFPARYGVEERERFSLAALSNSHLGPHHAFHLDILAWIASSLLAVNDAERAGSPVPAWRAYGSLGIVAGLMRLPWLAHLYFRRARNTPVQQDPITGRINPTDSGEGLWHMIFGRKELTLSLSARAVEQARRFSDRNNLPSLLGYMASSSEFWLTLDEALRFNEEQLAVARENANAQFTSWALIESVPRLLAQNRGKEAQARLAEAERLLGGVDRLAMASFHANAALAFLRGGAPERAAAEADKTLVLWRANSPTQVADISAFTSLVEACLGLWEGARRRGAVDEASHRVRAEAACGMLQVFSRRLPIAQSRAYRFEGVRARMSGRPRRALRLLERALIHARQREMPYDEAMAFLELARTTQDAALQAEYLLKARTLLAHLGYLHELEQVDVLSSGASFRDDARSAHGS